MKFFFKAIIEFLVHTGIVVIVAVISVFLCVLIFGNIGWLIGLFIGFVIVLMIDYNPKDYWPRGNRGKTD